MSIVVLIDACPRASAQPRQVARSTDQLRRVAVCRDVCGFRYRTPPVTAPGQTPAAGREGSRSRGVAFLQFLDSIEEGTAAKWASESARSRSPTEERSSPGGGRVCRAERADDRVRPARARRDHRLALARPVESGGSRRTPPSPLVASVRSPRRLRGAGAAAGSARPAGEVSDPRAGPVPRADPAVLNPIERRPRRT